MIYKVTTRNCELSKFAKKNIDRNIKKLSRFLYQFEDDLPILSIIIRGHKRKNYYDGSINLQLPKKNLFAGIAGINIDEALTKGFETIYKELETYKGLHFKSNSEFYDRRSLRELMVI